MRSEIYRGLVKQVAQGLSQEDATELAVGLCRTAVTDCRWTILGSAWLYWLSLVLATRVGLYRAVIHAEVNAPSVTSRRYDYTLTLMIGLFLHPLPVWKVCQRRCGIVYAHAPRADLIVEPDISPLPWRPLMVGLVLALIVIYTPHTEAGVYSALFAPFYIQSGGNAMNAGSTTANAADVTSTNGSWDITADTFIATGGTPFSAVVANTDYASIYTDGTTTGAVYVALITTVNLAGLSITLSTTTKYGTKPSASATGRSCKVNGAWVDETALVQLGSGAVPQATKINWKAATYTVTASRTIALSGTTTAPIWVSGYNTTPGDLDNDTTNTLTKPVLSLNGGIQVTASSSYQVWSGFDVAGTRSGTIWTAGAVGAPMTHVRCRFENLSSNVAAVSFTASTGVAQTASAYCWFKCPTTATTTGCVSGGSATWVGCVFEGGGLAGLNNFGSQTIGYCIFLNNTGSGILNGSSSIQCFQSTVYNSSGSGIKWSSTPTSNPSSMIAGCLFAICGGYGIENGSGTNTARVTRFCNDFYSCTSGTETGFGDYPAFFGQTDGSNPVTSSTDMTPVVGANARNKGFPGVFENQTYRSYVDIGAVQHPDAAGDGYLLVAN